VLAVRLLVALWVLLLPLLLLALLAPLVVQT
jgi:hypothetical protein